MIRKLVKLVKNPRKYFSFKYFLLLLKVPSQKACYLFQDSSFFMQGQMDIHQQSYWHSSDFLKLTGGFFPKNDGQKREICNLQPWDNTRRDMLVLLLRTLVEKNIEGCVAEVGVYKGYTAKLIHYYMPERQLHLFDTFKGFTDRMVASEKSNTGHRIVETHFADTSLDMVKQYIKPKNGNIHYHVGYFPESVPENFDQQRFAFVHLDADLYEPIMEGLKYFYPRMNKNGFLVIHDYNAWPGARKAVDEFFADKKEIPIPMPDKSGSALIVKQ